jgi:hypothetical protein
VGRGERDQLSYFGERVCEGLGRVWDRLWVDLGEILGIQSLHRLLAIDAVIESKKLYRAETPNSQLQEPFVSDIIAIFSNRH